MEKRGESLIPVYAMTTENRTLLERAGGPRTAPGSDGTRPHRPLSEPSTRTPEGALDGTQTGPRNRTWDLSAFSLGDMIEVGVALRRLGEESDSMEELAQRAMDFLHNSLRDQNGGPGIALARFFKTHAFQALPEELQEIVTRNMAPVVPPPALQCLTILGTCGLIPEWTTRRASTGHQAIPLANEAAVSGIPMVAALTSQLGFRPAEVAAPRPELFLEFAQRSFNVFLVENAVGSPHVPGQDGFVIPYGVRSVIGFGGVLTSGEVFATILFLRCTLNSTAAQLFKPLALNLRLAVLQHEGQVFA